MVTDDSGRTEFGKGMGLSAGAVTEIGLRCTVAAAPLFPRRILTAETTVSRLYCYNEQSAIYVVPLAAGVEMKLNQAYSYSCNYR